MTSLRILQLSTFDVAGGAEQVAMNLHRGFRAAGDDATLAVGARWSAEAGIVVLPNRASRGLAGAVERLIQAAAERLPVGGNLLRPLALAAQPRRAWNTFRGREDFDMPGTRALLSLPAAPPDVLHGHNLHGGYFDLRQLADLSARVPTFLTLHDMWTLTGHCAYSLGCERWRSGCGDCPDLSIYPPIRSDATRENLGLKRDVYRRSMLRVASPSRWLLDKARASVLAEGVVEWRLIPYGVDLGTFGPAGRASARERLGIGREALVLLYAANGGRANRFKDYSAAMGAAARISEAMPDRELVFLVLGGFAEAAASARTRFVPFVRDRAVMADYYRSADLFLHAAHEDNFPNTVLESQACGTPVIATSVGGIPEQIAEGATGILVPPRSPREMAEAALSLLRDRARLASMREHAAARARQHYDIDRQISDYRSWFSDAVQARRTAPSASSAG